MEAKKKTKKKKLCVESMVVQEWKGTSQRQDQARGGKLGGAERKSAGILKISWWMTNDFSFIKHQILLSSRRENVQTDEQSSKMKWVKNGDEKKNWKISLCHIYFWWINLTFQFWNENEQASSVFFLSNKDAMFVIARQTEDFWDGTKKTSCALLSLM